MKFRDVVLLLVSAFLVIGCADNNGVSSAGNSQQLADQKDKNKFHFRKTRWGMSKKQVKASETNEMIAMDDLDLVACESIVNGRDCFITYEFVNNKLAKAGYLFRDKHAFNWNQYIRDYKSLKDLLIKKYGWADRDIVKWNDELYKNDRERWGLAVILGHLLYGTEWQTGETEIFLSLAGGDYKAQCTVNYVSKTLGKLNDEKILEDF